MHINTFLLCFFFLKSFEVILRSLYELLGPNVAIHEPVTDDTIQKHSAILFEKLDIDHSDYITMDDFVKFCLRVCKS